MMATKLTLREVIRMLRDKDGWRLVGKGFNDDEATYRDTRIYTYLDCNGVAFRKYRDVSTENNRVYQANPFAHILTTIFTGILRRHLERKRDNN